ncbi:hypothetical protein AK812_SmicGene7265 [Symbiodinium microadriaticum]|uniref:Uncharacterized protein n=1 Tax=Symbiodinium microadriaticum TaxID=2951 RepID=A0A1Q9ENX9_SYMMI|nr:hypothetical protein AK812_SmicGene7265 [Symbiodinium microadriaticum]
MQDGSGCAQWPSCFERLARMKPRKDGLREAETMAMAYKPEAGVEMPDKRVLFQGLADTGPSTRSGEAARHPVERLLIDHSRREQQEEMRNKALE